MGGPESLDDGSSKEVYSSGKLRSAQLYHITDFYHLNLFSWTLFLLILVLPSGNSIHDNP